MENKQPPDNTLSFPSTSSNVSEHYRSTVTNSSLLTNTSSLTSSASAFGQDLAQGNNHSSSHQNHLNLLNNISSTHQEHSLAQHQRNQAGASAACHGAVRKDTRPNMPVSFADATRNSCSKVSPAVNPMKIIINTSRQGECGMDCPLPRINDSSFRQKWNNRQLSINCAVLFENFKDFRHTDYLEALCSVVEPSQIISIGNVGDGKISVVFASTQIAEKVLLLGITINDQFIQPIPFVSRPVRVVLSRIPAWIPDQPILAFLKQFGRITSSIRPLPINNNKIDKFTNILSNFREVFICLHKDAKLPPHIQIVDGEDTFSIDITTEQKCYACKEVGHVARACPRKNIEIQSNNIDFPELVKVVKDHQNYLGQISPLPEQQQSSSIDYQVVDRKQPAQSRLINQQKQQQQSQNLMEESDLAIIKSVIAQPTTSSGGPKRMATTSIEDTTSPKMFAAGNGSDSDSSMVAVSDDHSFAEILDGKLDLLHITKENMQQLLIQANRKRTPKIINKIIGKYTKSPKDLLDDLIKIQTFIVSDSINKSFTKTVDKLILHIQSH